MQTQTVDKPLPRIPLGEMLEISGRVRAVQADWLYQYCSAEGRSRLLREHVPLPEPGLQDRLLAH